MKKTIVLTLTLALAALMLFSSCSSCGVDPSERLMSNIMSAMENADSFEADEEIGIDAYYLGEAIKVEGSAKFIFSDSRDEGLYYYSSADSTVSIQGNETRTSAIEAFNEGVYFFSASQNGIDKNKIRSEHSEDEIIEYFTFINSGANILNDYGEIDFVKNDNTYTVTLEKYSGDIVRRLNESYGFPLENAGGKISDIKVTLTADSKFRITEIKTDYLFSNTAFTGYQKIIFSNYNKAEKIVDTINPGRYVLVDDARVATMLTSLLSGIKAKGQGSMTFTQHQVGAVVGGESGINEVSKVTYGVEDDKYYFTADSEINGEKKTIVYKDGVYKVDDAEQKGYNDYKIKKTIDGLIDPFYFSPYDLKIIGVTKTEDEDGSALYELELRTVATKMQEVVAEMIRAAGAYYQSMDAKIEFAIKDNKLVSLTYMVKVKGNIRQGNDTYILTLDITTVSEYDE